MGLDSKAARYSNTGGRRHEWLGQYLFNDLAEMQDHATRWLWTYNHDRPNMGLGGITPKQKLALMALTSTSETH